MSINDYLSPLLFVFIFLSFSAAIVWLISREWRRIAVLYPLQNNFIGKRWYFRSGRVAGIRLGSLLIVEADLRGVLFAAVFPFSFFIPPLIIPWDELTGVEHKGMFVRFVDLRFSKVPGYEYMISGRLADKLERGSEEIWKYKRARKRTFFKDVQPGR
jgi:hypothetical protein